MDIIYEVQTCVAHWAKSGEYQCRNIVSSPHCNPSDPDCINVLSTAYQTLIHATLSTWSPKSSLSPQLLVKFIQSVLSGLPSSSLPGKSSNTKLFGDILLDLIWTVDTELDEILADSRSIPAPEPGENEGVNDIQAQPVSKVVLAKQNAEKDKVILTDIIRRLCNAGIVEVAPCRERLDMTLLASAGMISDKVMFEKKEVRTKTALFYKQNKFNLLREQSEGYTKLSTDLVSSVGPPHSAATGYPVETTTDLKARARSSWQRVVSLIGYFDLDPNRALDIILDVFSTNLIAHHQFFLALLSCSPWAGDSKHMQSDAPEAMNTEADPEQYRGKAFDEILSLAESRRSVAGALSTSFSERKPQILAQVFGFKFSHYQAPDVTAICPRSLYLTAALLIRDHYITLEDLWPHLSPSDEEMPKLHDKYLASVNSRVKSSGNNLLAMAAPLESHGSSRTRTVAAAAETKTVEPKEVPNQKALLLVALLSVGSLRPAFAILSMFPWLVDTQREVADLLIRIMRASLNPLYNSTFEVKKDSDFSFSDPRPRYTIGGVSPPPPCKYQFTLTAPTPPSTATTEFVFFYPQWVEHVPLCSTFEDLVDVIEPFLRFTGLHLSREPLFLTKFLRVGKIHLAATIPPDAESSKGGAVIAELEHPTQEFWLKVIRIYLLPTLSMLPGNAVCTVDIWNIIKQYETTTRWKMYGEWRDVTYDTHPELKAQRIIRERETKGILRRLSAQTIDALAGPVAKMAHSNPCIFFTNAVSQIQAYENLADVVIQALRYATNMGFDILVFIILDALANPDKERVKDDGVYTSDWLQNLATFTGSLFRRYSSDLTPLLKYVVHQLYVGQTSEIVVLEKLILKMAGIEPLPTLSDAQITAMAGGPILRIEAVASDIRGAGFDVGEASLRGAPRLGKALIDTNLALPLIVQVAQQRQACVFKTRDAHLKSIAYLYDATHGVLFQYLDLLTTPSAVSLDDYRKMLPPMLNFSKDYGISSSLTMHIMRPLLNDVILKHALNWKSKAAEIKDKKLKVSDPTRDSSATPGPTTIETPNADDDVKMTNGNHEEQKGPAADPSPWIPEFESLFEDCRGMAPGVALDAIGAAFYLSFWQMSSYDIHYPKERYEETERLLRANSEVSHGKYRQAERSSEKSIRQTALSHRNQRERYLSTASDLRSEKETQEAVYKYTTDDGGRLDREKKHWFAHVPGRVKLNILIQSLMEHCIQPRCLLSPMDADFCARIVQVMHLRGTPGFPSLVCYDKILGDHVKVIIFSCTENEARNYGRFLKGVLRDLYRWHKDEKAFESSIRRKDRSRITLLPGFQKRWSHDGPSSIDDLLSWSDFRSFLKKCHRKLGKCFTECIEAGDFMHVYNAVVVLKEIIDVFPIASVNEVVGSLIDLEVQRLAQSEERGDLKILARAYSSSLKKREEIWAMPKTKVSSATVKAQTPQPSAPDQPRESLRVPEKPKESSRMSPVVAAPVPAPAPSPAPTSTAAADRSNAPSVVDRSVSTKLALESIPRPEVVKRVKHDSKGADSVETELVRKEGGLSADAMQVDPMNQPMENGSIRPPTEPAADRIANSEKMLNHSQSYSNLDDDQDGSEFVIPGLQTVVQEVTPSKSMPPPPEPTQDKHGSQNSLEDEGRKSSFDGHEVTPSPDMRVSSPGTTRPGTRNPSIDSRTSGDKVRSDRGDTEVSEDRRSGRGHISRTERGERNGHRDVSGRSRTERERGLRERTSTEDGERDRDERDRERRREREKERDRHSDKDRDRERDRDRGKERERERDRGDRERERDRHRRDDRERERESSRKDREQPSRIITTQGRDSAPGDHGLPSRPDAVRHRPSMTDDMVAKRRRAEEDSDRSLKRDSRDSRHRTLDDRSRRIEKDSRGHPREPRDSERRRSHRDDENDNKMVQDKPFESRGSRFDSEITSPKTPATPLVPPSAPRAMASGQAGRGRSEIQMNRGDRDWRGHGQRGSNAPSPVIPSSPMTASQSASLRARISEKDSPISPQLPSGPQRGMNGGGGERRHHDPEMHSDGRKRTMTDRENDKEDVAGNVDATTQPPKRPRINRNRYESGAGLARRVLPIDPNAGEKSERS